MAAQRCNCGRRGRWSKQLQRVMCARCYAEELGGPVEDDTPSSSGLPPSTTGPRLTAFSGIEAERVEWLWPGRVPQGMLALLVGDPGLGKSLLTCHIAAKVSQGGGHVVLSSAEDSAGATVRPRLEAAEADLERVHRADYVDGEGLPRTVELPGDVDRLAAKVEEVGARLLVIDPLTAHLPEQVNSWRDQSVRRALAPLHRLAEQTRCAVVVVAHLNKASGQDPLYRTGGSIAIPAAVRSALLLARDPEDPEGERGSRRVLAHHKSNISALADSLTYEIETVGETARLRSTGRSSVGARDLLDAPSGEERSKRDEAAELLRVELGDGPRPVKELQAAARDNGIGWRTVEEAKRGLGVETQREGFGPGSRVLWALPPIPRSDIDRSPYISDSAAYGESRSTSGIAAPQDSIGRNGSDIAAYEATGEQVAFPDAGSRPPAERPFDAGNGDGKLVEQVRERYADQEEAQP